MDVTHKNLAWGLSFPGLKWIKGKRNSLHSVAYGSLVRAGPLNGTGSQKNGVF